MSIESKTKEAILLSNQPVGSQELEWDNTLEAMDQYAKQEAIEFFKWYGVKMVGFIEYIKDIRPTVTSNEIEEKIKEFEGQTFEKLYELFSQQTDKQ